MSAMRLPARPSVEQLRKQAKELLAGLRAEDPDTKLSAAQLALAREYGFPSWPKLLAHVEEVRLSARIDHFERLADDMLAGYAGDSEALGRLIAYFGVSYDEEQVRVRLRHRIDNARESTDEDPTLDEVRHVVAREFGEDDWEGLAEALARPSSGGGTGPGGGQETEQVLYSYDPETRTIESRGPMTPSEWRRLADVMNERNISRLRSPAVTDEALEALTRVESLTSIDLEGAQGLTEAGVQLLSSHPELRELSLGGYHSPLGDGALEVLEHLPELRSFSMSWARRITDAGAVRLAHCPRLERVDLMGTRTGDGAVRALAGHDELQRLATGRSLTDDGVEALAFLPWYTREPIEPIELDSMSFSPGPGALLLDGGVTDAGLAKLVGLKGLQSLDLFWHAANFTPRGLAELAGAPALAYLGCPGERCTDEAMAAVARLPTLRMLMAQGAVASDAGFEALSAAESLEFLWGRECPNFGDWGFLRLSSMPSLRGLGVSLKGVSDRALEAFGDFAALSQLVPMHLDDSRFEHVGRVSNLERLWCMYCRETGDAATGSVAHLPLRTYYAGSTKITDRSLATLAEVRTLEEIELYQTAAVTSAGVRELSGLPSLRRLTITGLPRVRRRDLAGFRDDVMLRYGS